MTFKECIIFILAINLNPLGLWINSFTFEEFFNQQDHNIQNNEKHLPENGCYSQKEQVEQHIVR